MIVQSIRLISFRNFESVDSCFGAGANIFLGKNGAGKSNLLEAIFLLILGRSPRGARDVVMIKNGAEFYRLEGKINAGNRDHSISIGYQSGGKRKIFIDKISSRSSELFEKCTAVSAGPADIEILAGPPLIRRNFINIHLSQASAKYLRSLADYHNALEQKNAYLKQANMIAESPYDDLIAKYGAFIMLERKKFFDLISPRAVELYRSISGGGELLISYLPSVRMQENSWAIENIQTAFFEKLKLNRDREKFLQTAIIGPHRDDIDFYISGHPARTHGSQGELRTAAIALKLAVFEYLKKIRKTTPILLLDEVFAELDNTRRQKLIDSFGQFGQLFLTTATDIPELAAADSHRFLIKDGAITAIDP